MLSASLETQVQIQAPIQASWACPLVSVAHPYAGPRVWDSKPSSPTSGPVGVRSTGDLCPMKKHQFAFGGNSSKGQQLPHKTFLCRGLETLGMLRAPMGKIYDFLAHTVYSVMASRPERVLKWLSFLRTVAPLLLATHHQSNSNGFDTFGS